MGNRGIRWTSPGRWWFALPLLAILCGGCVEGDSGGEPVGESQYLIGPDGEGVYYRTPDGQNGFLEIDFTVASDAVVSRADASTFELIPGSLVWARDDDDVFYEGRPVPGADPSTIELLGPDGDRSGWTRDAQRVYRLGEPLPDADPATFTPLGENTRWSRDADSVYFERNLVEGADPNTFELLDNAVDGWARDAAHVYMAGEEVDGLDAGTFRVLAAGYYHDANALYYDGKRIDGADLSSVQARASAVDDQSNLAWDDGQLWFNGNSVTVRRNDGSIGTLDVDTLAATNTDQVLADADGVYGRLIDHPDRPAHFYQIDLVNPAAYEGRHTHSDDVLSFTLEPAGSRAFTAFDARDRPESLLRLGIFEIVPGADVERLGCAYWRRGSRIFYYGVLVEGETAATFSPENQDGSCRTEQWLLDVIDEFQE